MPSRGKKRVLAFENFSNNSPALGNLLEFQMRSMCLSELHNIDTIDVAFIYDFKNPFWDPKMLRWISPSNFQLHLYETLPLLNMNPKLGSVFVFNSRESFKSFLNQHIKEYVLCPSLFHYTNKSSAARGNYLFVRNFYLKKKYLPQFVFKPNIVLWAKTFLKRYVSNKYAVTINLRMNPLYGERRNSDIPSWQYLFRYCLEKHPDVTFLILARRNEAPEDLRDMPNVLFVKDYRTTMEQDMSLVKHGLFHMGVVSGPTSLTNFTDDISYCIFRVELNDKSYNYKWFKSGTQYPWQNKDLQKMIWENETPELLVKEFEHLFQNTDKKAWQQNIAISDAEAGFLEWPYIINDKPKIS